MTVFFATLMFGAGLPVQPALAGCSDYPAASVDWSGCRKRNIVLSGNDFTSGVFNGTDFAGSDLRDATFTNADFTKPD